LSVRRRAAVQERRVRFAVPLGGGRSPFSLGCFNVFIIMDTAYIQKLARDAKAHAGPGADTSIRKLADAVIALADLVEDLSQKVHDLSGSPDQSPHTDEE
jgi:hypothetical protein